MTGKKVIVNDGNAEKALRKFKKMIAESGILQEVRDRQHYVKKSQAKRRWDKYLREQTLPKKLY